MDQQSRTRGIAYPISRVPQLKQSHYIQNIVLVTAGG